MSAELAHQTCRGGSGCGRDHVSPALNSELKSERADGTGRSEDQDGLSRPQIERVDALECGQSSRGNRPGLAQAEFLRHTAHILGMRRDKLGVKATFAVAELVRVDAVTGMKAPDPGAFGRDNSRAVDTRHQRESRSPGLSP